MLWKEIQLHSTQEANCHGGKMSSNGPWGIVHVGLGVKGDNALVVRSAVVQIEIITVPHGCSGWEQL